MIQRPTRLEIKPFRPISEHIDGAWWPRSRRLVEELPGLVTSVADQLGPIAMIGYHHHSWDDAPPVLEIGGRTVELLGFSGDEPDSVILIGQDGHHLSLQVIPPDSSEQSGEQALQGARCGADNEVAAASRSLVARSVADVAEKLARHEGRGDEKRAARLRPQIRQWCEDAAQQFLDAPVQTFVPILVEHIVRNRLMESRAAAASAV